MLITNIFLFCVIFTLEASATFTTPSKTIIQNNRLPNAFIVGGKKASRNQFPYQAALLDGFSRRYHCGGAIISEQWIVTAAHCTQGRLTYPENLRVLVGATDIRTDGKEHAVAEIILHKGYRGFANNFEHDISLVMLANTLHWDVDVKPVMLNDLRIDGGAEAVISGWGLRKVCAKKNKK